ncbi:MAG: hypothetical protein QM586_03175 [Xenophilus sp.]
MREILIPLWVLADQRAIEVEGDRRWQRAGALAGVVLFVLLGSGLAVAPFLDAGLDAHGQELLLAGLYLALAACIWAGIHLCWKVWRRPDGTGGACRIDAEGFFEGDRERPFSLRWSEVGGARWWLSDVRTEFVSGRSMVRCLRIERRGGEPVRLPLSLGRDWRYPRHRELLRALLLWLATEPRPPLRFDADVFVDACIDPDTWGRSLAPKWRQWGVMLAIMAPVLVLLATPVWMEDVMAWTLEHPFMLVAGLLAYMLLAAGAVAWWWDRRYPRLTGMLRFRVAD